MLLNMNLSCGKYLLKEKKFQVLYKDKILPHHYFADFTVFDCIILEIKAITHLSDAHIAQRLNYLKIPGKKLAILVNFEADRLIHQRIIL